jgi:hypothetical protein
LYRQPRSGFTRIPYVQSCTVLLDGRTDTGLICNLSLLGVYLHLDPIPESGSKLSLHFMLPDGDVPIEAEATVTWVNDAPPDNATALPTGCGLRFTGLAPGDVRRLSAMISDFEADPQGQLGRSEPRTDKVRIPFVAPCVLSSPAGLSKGNVCNLSTSGVYVSVDPIPEVGATTIVAFRLPGLEDLFERAAVVAWRNVEGPGMVRALPPGCGLRFANLSHSDREHLADLVEEYNGMLPAGGGER